MVLVTLSNQLQYQNRRISILPFALLLLLLQLTQSFRIVKGLSSTWWSSVAQLGANTDPNLLLLGSQPLCSQLPGLSSGQARVCELFVDHMPAVGFGARAAIEECQNLFEGHRWNCSTAFGNNVFGPAHPKGTREAAFTYGLLSAGVTHEVSRSCRKGQLSACGCSNSPRPKNLHSDWAWGGCGDNVEHGYEFSRNFIDIRERESTHPKDSESYGRALMNRWNNEVGRKLVKRRTSVNCKCHGVSGSCNLKTCWRQLPTLKKVGRMLRDKYEDAVMVKVNKRGNLQLEQPKPNHFMSRIKKRRKKKNAKQLDLVYLHESPTYCDRNSTMGTLGTSGRKCNIVGSGSDSCEMLCCGRGYHTYKKIHREKCGCKFVWCCQVVCQVCIRKMNEHICK